MPRGIISNGFRQCRHVLGPLRKLPVCLGRLDLYGVDDAGVTRAIMFRDVAAGEVGMRARAVIGRRWHGLVSLRFEQGPEADWCRASEQFLYAADTCRVRVKIAH